MISLPGSFKRAWHTAAGALVGVALACAVAPVSAAALYTNVVVSDNATGDNSLGNANTSRKLAVGADGTIYALYYSPTTGIRVARSATRGQSFSPSVQVSSTGAEAEIAVSSTGIIYVVWISSGNAVVSRSLDGGQTFSAPVTAGAASSSVHMATDAAYVYLFDRAGNNFHVSADNGLTFSTVAVNAGQAFSDVHVDRSTGDVVLQVDDPSVKYYLSTDHGATVGAQIQPAPGGSVFYSVGTLSSGSNGRYLFVAGGTGALRINLADSTSVDLASVFGSNSVNNGRSLSADLCGNVVDGYVTGGAVTYHVSNDLGANFGAPVTVATSNSSNVFINATNGDILFLYAVASEVYLNVYSGELGNCYTPEVNVSSLVFGAQLVAQASSAQSVTITNTGAVAVQITGIASTGDFAATSTACVGTLGVGQSCSIPVVFTPTAAGTRTGELQVQTNVFPTPRIVNLSGVGVTNAPVASFSPTPVAFGNVGVGGSATQTVTLTNVGNAVMNITGFAVSGPFGTSNNTCGATLAAAATCTIDVTFSPAATGSASGSLVLTADTAGAPPSVALSGTGVTAAPQIGLSAGSFSFGPVSVGTTGTQTLTITNVGQAVLNLTSITVTGTDFSISANTCGATLAIGASCTVTVAFAPGGTDGYIGNLAIVSDDPAGDIDVPLVGVGVPPAAADVVQPVPGLGAWALGLLTLLLAGVMARRRHDAA